MAARSAFGPWAVYEVAIRGRHTAKPTTMRVVCEQTEWEKLFQSNPDAYSLIRGGIVNETDAERLAREVPANIVG